MRVLVLGASGATGRLVVSQLLEREVPARIVVREQSTIPESFEGNDLVEIIRVNIDEVDLEKFRTLVADCESVICCLGHNLSFKGLFGPPRRLVFNQVKKIAEAADISKSPKRFVLMSTTAYSNRHIGEKLSGKEKVVFGLLKLLLPPHRDNMLSADYLIEEVGSDTSLEWVAVRPDTLIDEASVTPYDVYETKQRNALSDPGKTSRIVAAHFMAELITNAQLWERWKYQTPVVYCQE